MRFADKLFTALVSVFAAADLFAAGKAQHVVVLVWDGMRPDFVTEADAPTLFKLARQGVAFKHHHPVYISTTIVNGTALATGNIDLAPTVLWLLGVQPRQRLSGRLLTEVLVEPPAPAPSRQSHHFEVTCRASTFVWRQHLDCSTVGETRYVDQGDGEQMPADTAGGGSPPASSSR